MGVYRLAFTASVFLGIAALSPLQTNAITSICTNGGIPHIATAQEAASANPPGSIKAGETYVCPNDARLGISNEAGEAKQYLRSILCGNSQYGGAGPDGTVQGLDSKFAVCAAKFLKAATQSGIQVCLREGYRTTQQQQKYYQEYLNGGGIACGKNGPQNCEHPRGIAIDVNTTSETNYQRLWSMGPQFGVNFYLRARDKVHFVPLQGGCSGGTQNVQPGQALPPNFYDFPQYAPSNPFNTQNGFPPPPPPPPPMMQQQSPYSSQQPFSSPLSTPTSSTGGSTLTGTPIGTTGGTQGPQICSPKFTCESGVMYYNTSSCTKQFYENCKNGCDSAGAQCAIPVSSTLTSTSTPTTPLASSTSFSTQTGQSFSPISIPTGENISTSLQGTSSSFLSGSSIVDLLTSYAQQFTSSITGAGQSATNQGGQSQSTSTPVTLNQGLGNASGIGTEGVAVGPVNTVTGSGSTTGVIVNPLVAEQTFSAANSGPTPATPTAQDKTLLGLVLSFFKTVLLWAQAVLNNLRS